MPRRASRHQTPNRFAANPRRRALLSLGKAHSLFSLFSLLAGLVALPLPATAQAPDPGGYPQNYPSTYAELLKAARREGKVVVYATTDLSAVSGLIKDFEARFPGVHVDYQDLNSAELHNRYLVETRSGKPSADVLWSSAMDLQIKLTNDSYAAAYKSPEAPHLPEWAVWRDEAYGTTFEPAVFVYSKRHVPPADVPQTHADFALLLKTQRAKYAGNVSTYDVERSAVGFLFASQDSRVQSDFWDLVNSLGRNTVNLEVNTSVMVQRIASGKDYLGYNLIGSYAMTRARRDPAIGVVLPKDYTLVMSRILLISKTASHPNAARLWMDYLLSQRGQGLLASQAELFAIRDDVPGEFTASTLRKTLGGSLKTINVGPALLVFQDKAKQQDFFRRWTLGTQTPLHSQP
ncbi:ABC transporter substrate-binding protein [Roseateles koreensis]|uniref:ABC transporter substrate-binding protein n=1 Tax=Roseateles koreensis TaxID=2987526 RepID=A0ABT5KQZ5_9BURK|nr:ABC transporter substrate-binding protein [Roseateles koreensis]MDC8785343.1 ABC transporter substrate-binding protein [Roseateles koreensis]